MQKISTQDSSDLLPVDVNLVTNRPGTIVAMWLFQLNFVLLQIQLYAIKRLFVTLFLLILGVTIAQAQVSGLVFRDFNANGQKDNSAAYNEIGLQGIIVTGYPQTGSPVSATTNSSGAYSLAGLSGAVRIEFSGLSTGDYSGPQGAGSKTSVQFVTAPATNINFGVNAPDDYWDNTNQPVPSLVLPCYINGSQTQGAGATMDAIVQISNSANGLTPPHQTVAQARQVGAVWGTAFQKAQKRYFFASFVKRHVAFGPQGIGGVYIADPSGSTYGITGSFSLQGVVPANGGSALDLGTVNRSGTNSTADNFVESTPGNPNRDLNAFVKVGTAGFGDIDIDEARQTLYLVNMNQRRLVTLDVSGGTASLNNASAATLGPLTKAYDILSLPGIPTAQGGQLRPWGLKIYKGRGYLGVVADASQQTNARTNSPYFPNLRAYVLSFDVTNIAAGFRTELSLNMSYRDDDVSWRSWVATPYNAELDGSAYQPILSDIEFDEKGGMILGFLDRWGHQIGHANYEPVSGSTALLNTSAYGDILYACYDPVAKTWSMEGPGSCPINTTNDIYNAYGGTGEYFNDLSGDGISETGMGALAKLMGTNRTIAVVGDPFPFSATAGLNYGFSGGIHWFNQSTGNWDQYARIYGEAEATTFGKAHGLGDIEANLTPPPIEIGNRVWNDVNNNGIQDPNETGIAGVSVSLCTGAGTPIATAVTDANGTYYFSSASGTNTANAIYNLSTLTAGTSYQLKFPTNTGGRILVSANTGSNDLIDSDASASGLITFTTGTLGANDHSFDVGYTMASCAIAVSATPGPCDPATNLYTVSGTISLTSAVAGTATITDGSSSTTVAISSGATSVPYSLGGLTSNGASHTISVSLPNCGTATSTYTAPAACTVGLGLSVTPGVCQSATNQYSISGTLSLTNAVAGTATITDGSSTTIVNIAAGATSVPYSLNGLTSDGSSHTVTVSYAGKNASTTYTAPASCSVTPPCLLAVSVTPGICNPATNQYSISGTVSASNATGTQIITLVDGAVSTTLSLNGNGPVSFTLTGLNSNGMIHTLTATAATCGMASTTYTAPTSCTLAVAVSVTPGVCQSATNQYSISGTLSLTNAVAGTATILDGSNSTTVAVANGATSVAYSLSGLSSGTGSHTITVTYAGKTASASYTAPASCSVAPPALAVVVGSPVCNSATNNYSATGTVSLTNATAGTLTITDNGITIGTVNVTAGQTTAAFSVSGVSNTASHTVIATLTGGISASTVYTAPVACTYTCPAPIHECKGSNYSIELSTTAGLGTYQWYRDGVAIQGATASSYTATQAGTYSVVANGNVVGQCPDGSCCPIVIVEDSIAIYQAIAQKPSCNTANNTANADGSIVVSNWKLSGSDTTQYVYQVSLGSSFNPAQVIAGGTTTPVPANGVLVTNLVNPVSSGGQSYTVRISTGSGCYRDVTVVLGQTVCGCPPTVCVPLVIKRVK